MSQPRRTYGRRPPTENVRSFMTDVKNHHEERKRGFEADHEISDSAPAAKKPCVTPFKLPQKPGGFQHQQSEPKRPRAFDEESITGQSRAKKQLPTPPAEPGLAATSLHSHNLSKNQKKRLRRKQKKEREQLAMEKISQQRRLPSPPPSVTNSIEATTSPVPSPALRTMPTLQMATDHDALVQSHQPDGPSAHTPLSISANGGPIESLSTELFMVILDYVLPARNTREIRPLYMKGMLRYGIRSEPNDDDGVIQNENIDLSVFRTSRAFHQVGTRLFYGGNRFFFDDPDACDWHKSRAVGHNFYDVESARSKIDPCVFEDMCTEEKWYGVFAKHIQPHHQLSRLTIALDGWKNIALHYRDGRYTPKYEMTFIEDRYSLHKWRGQLLNFVDDYMRGISNVKIICINVAGRGLTQTQIHGLEMVMSTPKETAKERKTRQRMTFAELMEAMRLDKEAGETQKAASDCGFDYLAG